MEDNLVEKPGKRHFILWLVILLFAAGIIAYLYQGILYSTLQSLNLAPTQQHLTELYFTNPSTLPRSTIAKIPSSFSFTIHNLEGVDTTYPYIVYFVSPTGVKTIFVQATTTLQNNASETITVTHTYVSSDMTGKVVVDLPSQKDQQIDFHLPYTN